VSSTFLNKIESVTAHTNTRDSSAFPPSLLPSLPPSFPRLALLVQAAVVGEGIKETTRAEGAIKEAITDTEAVVEGAAIRATGMEGEASLTRTRGAAVEVCFTSLLLIVIIVQTIVFYFASFVSTISFVPSFPNPCSIVARLNCSCPSLPPSLPPSFRWRWPVLGPVEEEHGRSLV